MKAKLTRAMWFAVLDVLAATAEISFEDALGRSRYRKIIAVRHAAFKFFRDCGYGSYTIARASGFSPSLVKCCGNQRHQERRRKSALAWYYVKKAEKACEQRIPERVAA
jgi:hypothetical protein